VEERSERGRGRLAQGDGRNLDGPSVRKIKTSKPSKANK
jgi:hypothetical protein